MRCLLILLPLLPVFAQKWDPAANPIPLPKLLRPPVIDGNLSEWKELAFHDGVWDIHRLRHSPWYDPARNRLTDHGNEPAAEDDLQARYYTAWDDDHFYFGAEVKDNVNDVDDPQHEPKRWYFKDAICWFIEAPRDEIAEQFGQGDNAFCFVLDAKRPLYAAWWRHGAPGKTYVEEPIPPAAVAWSLRFHGKGNVTLEAAVKMSATLPKADPSWHAPRVGDVYSLEIVHTDPDGGGYGGHFILYGTGDDDSTWGKMVLTAPQAPIERKRE